MSKNFVYYNGFKIFKYGSFWRIEKRPGYFAWLEDAKRFIDETMKREKKNQKIF